MTSNWFYPATKAGGPINSAGNFVKALSCDYEIFIITDDRDFGESTPYPGVIVDKFCDYFGAKVFYCSSLLSMLKVLINLLRSNPNALLFLNSFCSIHFSIVPMIMRRLKVFNNKVVVSPRGEFNVNALSIKANKKRLFLLIAQMFGLYKSQNIFFHGSSEYERNDIAKIFKKKQIFIAPDVVLANQESSNESLLVKDCGFLRVIFLSRISKMKNLEFAIEVLASAKGEVVFDIFGPLEDQDYWKICLERIALLPKNIKVNYCGEVEKDDVRDVMKKYHLFFSPTLGEGFGHAIYEALTSNCILLISDRTPWRKLEMEGVGWDISLDSKVQFVCAINKLISIEKDEYMNYLAKISRFLKKINLPEETVSSNRSMIETVFASAGIDDK